MKFSATEQDIRAGRSSGLVPGDVQVEPDNVAPVLTGSEVAMNNAYDAMTYTPARTRPTPMSSTSSSTTAAAPATADPSN